MTGFFSVTPIFKKMLFTGSTGTGTKPACPRLKEIEPGNGSWLGGTSLRDGGDGASCGASCRRFIPISVAVGCFPTVYSNIKISCKRFIVVLPRHKDHEVLLINAFCGHFGGTWLCLMLRFTPRSALISITAQSLLSYCLIISNVSDFAVMYSYFHLWPFPLPQKNFLNLKGLIFLCRYGKFHGYRPEENSVSRTCSSSQLTIHHQLPKTASDLVQRRAQDHSQQQNVSCSKL